MYLLSDIITYVRRIIKSPSDSSITDNLIIDYINRFYISDIDARLQLFDYKTKYQFQTVPGVDKYNMPLYSVQSGISPNFISPAVSMYPVYQGFLGPAYINGVQTTFETQKNVFYGMFPNIVQNQQVVGIGNGTTGPYVLNLQIAPNNTVPPNPPLSALVRGHVDISGIIGTGFNEDPPLADNTDFNQTLANIPTTSIESSFYITSIDEFGNSVVVADTGIFLESNVNCCYLMVPGKAPNGNQPLINGGGYSETVNTINYLTGQCTVYFNNPIPSGVNINAQCVYFQTGLPRSILYNNNCITLRCPPDKQYLVEIDAYLSPAAFFNTAAAIPFGYMAEYIARGAARKILSDTGDADQLAFYEPLFREQEMLVWKRSQRQWTSTRTETIYSRGNMGSNFGNNGNIGY